MGIDLWTADRRLELLISGAVCEMSAVLFFWFPPFESQNHILSNWRQFVRFDLIYHIIQVYFDSLA